MENLLKEQVKNLIGEIVRFLYLSRKKEEVERISFMLRSFCQGKAIYTPQKPNIPPKEKSLLKALNLICDESILPIKNSISNVINQLKWSVDNGLFYEQNSQIGDDYLSGNMHAELIGPKNGIFKYGDLRLGLFLLEPNIFYKDHKHEAPELYLNLSNGTSWRFEKKEWEKKKAGSIIYNQPFTTHAMYVGNEPFFSVWCWPKNSSKKCVLVDE